MSFVRSAACYSSIRGPDGWLFVWERMRAKDRFVRCLLCASALSSAACYATKSVKPENLRALGARLSDVRPLPTESEGVALLEADSLVRLNLVDGMSTGWIPAGDLYVSEDAVFFESGISSACVGSATVSNLAGEQAEKLKALAPPGGVMSPEKDLAPQAFRLTANPSTALLPWIGRFVTEQRTRDAPEGRWFLERRPAPWWHGAGKPRPFAARFDTLKGPLSGEEHLFAASGALWTQVESVDVNYLHPTVTALAVPLWPLALLSGPESDGREETDPYQRALAPRQIWRTEDPPAQPLFSWQGKRRAFSKLLLAYDGGASYGADLYFSFSAGLRLWTFLEFSFVMREMSNAPVEGLPRQASTLVGGSMGMHVDGDGDPSFAFYFGIEGVNSVRGEGVSMISLVFGPRFGLGNDVYVMIVPLSATSICRHGGRYLCLPGTSSIYSAVQMGIAY